MPLLSRLGHRSDGPGARVDRRKLDLGRGNPPGCSGPRYLDTTIPRVVGCPSGLLSGGRIPRDRSMKIKNAAWLLEKSGGRRLLGAILRWSGVLCLNYHRIGDASASHFDWGLWSAGADAFEDQVRFLESHCNLIGPGDLPDVLARGKGRFVLLTFDDGYRDNYEIAFPILKRHNAARDLLPRYRLPGSPALVVVGRDRLDGADQHRRSTSRFPPGCPGRSSSIGRAARTPSTCCKTPIERLPPFRPRSTSRHSRRRPRAGGSTPNRRGPSG